MADGDMKFECSACNRRYTWKPEFAGKRVKCKCGEPILVPASLSPEVQDAPPDFNSYEFRDAAAATASMPVKPAAPSRVSSAAPARTPKKSPAPLKRAPSAPVKEKLSDRWWAMIAMGIIVVVMAFAEFGRLSDFERHGGTVYLGRLEYILYAIGGRWGVLIVLVLAGGSLSFFGVQKFVKLQNDKNQ